MRTREQGISRGKGEQAVKEVRGCDGTRKASWDPVTSLAATADPRQRRHCIIVLDDESPCKGQMPRLKKSISAFDGSDVGISGFPVDRADRALQPRVFAWIASILPVMVVIVVLIFSLALPFPRGRVSRISSPWVRNRPPIARRCGKNDDRTDDGMTCNLNQHSDEI